MNNRKIITWIVLAMISTSLACNALMGVPQTAAPTSGMPLPTEPAPSLPSVTETNPAADPTATEAPPSPQPMSLEFGVIRVAEGDVLNVRSGPGVENDIVAALDPHATGIRQTGNRQKVAHAMWVEIATPAEDIGWVNAHFLTELVPSDQFCADARVEALLDDFVTAIQARNGSALAELVSPTHGLTLRISWWNPEITFKGVPVLDNLFEDTAAHDWGIQDGSGMPIQGAFKDEALPWMDDVFNAAYTRQCNDLENGSGSSAGYILWPYEYHNINYVALFRAPAPGDELNWRTWAVGIQYHQGRPYIAYLVQYHWEI